MAAFACVYALFATAMWAREGARANRKADLCREALELLDQQQAALGDMQRIARETRAVADKFNAIAKAAITRADMLAAGYNPGAN